MSGALWDDEVKWHRRFLEMAKLVSSWSKDSTKVGAVIADPETHRIISLGYNGFPRGVLDIPERYSDRDTKLKFVVHAEMNAILNAGHSVRGMDMYVYPTMMVPPSCPDCSKVIVQSGISRVFGYVNDEPMPERWQSLAKFSSTILYEGNVFWYVVERENANEGTISLDGKIQAQDGK